MLTTGRQQACTPCGGTGRGKGTMPGMAHGPGQWFSVVQWLATGQWARRTYIGTVPAASSLRIMCLPSLTSTQSASPEATASSSWFSMTQPNRKAENRQDWSSEAFISSDDWCSPSVLLCGKCSLTTKCERGVGNRT